MIGYNRKPKSIRKIGNVPIATFIEEDDSNIDWITVESFGEEWSKFYAFSEEEINKCGDDYFDILPKSFQNKTANVLDMAVGVADGPTTWLIR